MRKRKNPTVSEVPSVPERSPDEKMLDDMHDALYALGDRIRKPFPRPGEKLLPKRLRAPEPAGASAARKHIKALHNAMRGEK